MQERSRIVLAAKTNIVPVVGEDGTLVGVVSSPLTDPVFDQVRSSQSPETLPFATLRLAMASIL